MKKVIWNSVIGLLCILLTGIIACSFAFGAETANWMNRGFSISDSLHWTAEHWFPQKQAEQERDWYPMANANIDWNLLWREP